MDLKRLYQNSVRVSEGRANPPQDTNWKVDNIVASKGTKTVLFQAKTLGHSSHKIQAINLMFTKLKIEDEFFPGSFPANVKQGRVWIEKPSFSKNEVKARCSCHDFFFTFAYYLWENGSIFGVKPRSYTRKTTTRASRNPQKLPGICHHIIQLASILDKQKVLKP